MLTSSLAILHDNAAHGEDNYLTRDLGDGNFLDVVLDGVTGHGGDEASGSVADALNAATITGRMTLSPFLTSRTPSSIRSAEDGSC